MRERSNWRSTHDGEHEVAHGGVLGGEDQALFDGLRSHAFSGEALNQGTYVIEVTGEPVQADRAKN